ncbi:MAG: CopG family transcriptional regulator [Eubacteriales bacterium]|nr:CopG family transcriptional regulator [Eubacteriales bacterium]
MPKTLYSLMLNDEVVREVDLLAHRLGTNRSNLINEILAEYVNYTTPEKRINDVLSAIQELMQPSEDLIPFFAPHTYSMSLKSSLDYKYRPTIKYEVELNKGYEENIGTITVLFRTQSPMLIESMTEFFRLWVEIEQAHLTPLLGVKTEYALYDGRFSRSLARPDRDCTSNELASALAEYIRLFDKLLKGWLSGRYDAHAVEAAYYSFIRNSKVRF